MSVCEFPDTPTTLCTNEAKYATSVMEQYGIFKKGPLLCKDHLGERIASLLGRYLTVTVGVKKS